MPTVIDALVVQLELDTTNYKRSWKDVDNIDDASATKRDKVTKRNDREEKERARVEKQNALDRKKHTDELTGSVVTLGKSLAAAVLGYESVIGFAKELAKLTGGEAALGRSATKLGISPAALNIYGKAVEYAGGKPEDALATFSKLTQEKSNKDLKGEIGPLLQLLQQKGVNYEDKNGNLLDQGKILDDLSKKTQNMKNQDRANMFAQAGIADGVINRMLEETKEQERQLDKAREFNRITEKGVKVSEDLVEKWHQMGDAADKAATKIRNALVPTANHSMDAVTKLASGDVKGANQSAGGAILDVGKLYERYTEKFYGGAANLAEQVIDHLFGGSAPVAPKAGTLAARNNNPGNIKDKKTGQFKQYATLAEGQAAMHDDLEYKINHGNDTIAKLIARYEGSDTKKDPNATRAYIERASKLTGKDTNAKLTEADLPALMNAMTIVESGLPNSAMRAPPPSGATPSIVGSGSGSASGNIDRSGGNTTNVTVNKIEVNSNSADPTQVANQTGDALQRKITVAQANTGQQ
jgi:hypothetical protein